MEEKETNPLRKLLDDVQATTVNELQCDQAEILMAQSTHDGLSEEASKRQYPLLWQHFQFCPDCAEEYQMLVALTEMERSGELQRPLQIPPIPDGRKTSLLNKIKETLTQQFPGFQPAVAIAVQRGGGSLEMEPVEVGLDDDYAILFDLTSDEEDAAYRHLYGTLLVENDELLTACEGNPVWLQLMDGKVIQEKSINELGDFVFSHINPGNYQIRLGFSSHEFIITDISVP